MSDDQITIRDFKTWLRGVEEFQGEGWAPSVEQWAVIRKKIELLKEESNVQSSTTTGMHLPPPQMPPMVRSTPTMNNVPPNAQESQLQPPMQMPQTPKPSHSSVQRNPDAGTYETPYL